MATFENHGFTLRYEHFAPVDAPSSTPSGRTVMLVHGFASNIETNWVNPGWVQTLTNAGHSVLAFDHRGHGKSSGSRTPDDYAPQEMAADAIALLDHCGFGKADFLGYSMGARVSTFAALAYPTRVATLCLGGIGSALVKGSGFWGPVHDALLAEDAATITDTKALMFRKFADQTGSDRIALAACIQGSRANVPAEALARISQPTLIAVGTRDDVAGDAEMLATLIPGAQVLHIEGRDHMLAVGDKTFKQRYLAFLGAD